MGFIELGKLFSAMENQISMHDFWINHIIVSLLLHKKVRVKLWMNKRQIKPIFAPVVAGGGEYGQLVWG